MLASRGVGAAAGRGGGGEEAEGRSERSEYVCVLGGEGGVKPALERLEGRALR